MSKSLWSLLLYSILLTTGQVLFKLSAAHVKSLVQHPLALAHKLFNTPVFLAGCLLYALSTLLWVALLSRLPLSQAYPLVIATSIILTALLGIVVFKEQLTIDKIAGLPVISLGVKILSRSMQ